jgi:GT2 family glycosyltransferase
VHFGLSLFDDDRHFTALESLSLQNLAEGDLVKAFRFADRRCRIPPAVEPHHYTLRAEISYRMGHIDAAIDDLKLALDQAPDNLAANRRMLAWSHGQWQIDAARRLIYAERDFGNISRAIAVLCDAGEDSFGAFTATDSILSGWAVWSRFKRARVMITSDGVTATASLIPDATHALANEALNAASFTVERPHSQSSQHAELYVGKTLLYQRRLLPNGQKLRHKGSEARNSPAKPDPINIVVPVYGHYEATKACFDSLFKEIENERRARVTIVDDASPDINIKRFVRSNANRANVRLLTNEHNLGFAQSANRGLEEIETGDVILLNADTIVPPGFIARLNAAAHSAPEIGTVTPFSNNGEFTSFPVPFRVNPIPTYEEICAIDATAARVNGGRVIDLPNGIGFCLYITRRCLNAVGRLSIAFHRGYLEDVEFCLRAREMGFRNVCATSVYIGHAGSRSFGSEKRSLVVRNVDTIQQLFPKYRVECGAFMEADPLRPAREAIERSVPKCDQRNTVLVVTASGLAAPIARARAQKIAAKGARAMVVELRAASGRPQMRIRDASENVPQSMLYDLSAAAEHKDALDYLRGVEPARIEIVSAARVPPTIFELFLTFQCPIDLVIADGSLLCPHGEFLRSDGSVCSAPRRGRLCDDCLFGLTVDGSWNKRVLRERGAMLGKLIQRARRIYGVSASATSFASRLLGRRKIIEIKPSRSTGSKLCGMDCALPERCIGFVACSNSAAEYCLMKSMALAINRKLPDRSIVVIGSTIDDIGLMRLDNVHVTGEIEASECRRILLQYGITTLVVPIKEPVFGHPTIIDLATYLPTAFFDWSFGAVALRSTDLAMSPDLSDNQLVAILLPWLARN